MAFASGAEPCYFRATGCACRNAEHVVRRKPEGRLPQRNAILARYRRARWLLENARAALAPVGHLGEIQRAQLLARLAPALDTLAARYAWAARQTTADDRATRRRGLSSIDLGARRSRR
jgi:recombinational DNA repair ATPase RecF